MRIPTRWPGEEAEDDDDELEPELDEEMQPIEGYDPDLDEAYPIRLPDGSVRLVSP